MIASVQANRPQVLRQQHREQFVNMLPRIRSQARLGFRQLRREHQEDMIEEVIANAYCAFVRLVHRDKASIAFATPLANYAIRQVIAGRRVGSKSNIHDVTSPYARSAQGIIVERLNTFDRAQGEWRAALIEGRRATPADIAAARIDMAAWFRSLSLRNRRIAISLAMGESTSEVAQRFGLSCARVSQIRGLLKANWERFQRGGAPSKCGSAAV
jgi:hypothetical protein